MSSGPLWGVDSMPLEVINAKLRLCEALTGDGKRPRFSTREFNEIMELIEEYVDERLLYGK